MIKLQKPKFISFEGGEGSGKSTQSKMLHEYLLSQNIKSIHTREVGGTKEAEKIRDLLVYSELMPTSELMLIMAARYEHINKVIIPAFLEGSWVICDRFIDSTACYQSTNSNLSLHMIYELHKKLMIFNTDNININDVTKDKNIAASKADITDYQQQAIMPNLTFFLDIPPNIGLERANSRGDVNKFEEKNISFHNMVYNSFKKIKSIDKDRFIEIESINKTPNEIHQNILYIINQSRM